VKRARSDALQGYAFILPAFLIFLLVIFAPLLGTVAMSFAKFQLIGTSKWVGLLNFTRFFSDPRLGVIYGNTLKFVVILVVLHLVIGLLLALGVRSLVDRRLMYVYRTVFFFPVLVTTASVAIAWLYMFSTSFGIFNYFLGLLGIKAVPWLNSPLWVYVAVAIFSLWKFVGNSFIYYLIGLQSIPVDLYEAAMLDGASAVQRFFRVTLPLLTPTIFFVMVNLIIGATQIFDEPYFLTAGGPGDASRPVGLYIYENAFQFHNLSYGSTLALSLFLVILFVTFVQFSAQKRWVFYGNE
jgi:multiple sugar transport system permease protein